jgi:hypothetical protein
VNSLNMTPDEGDGDEFTDELLKEHGLLVDRMEAAGRTGQYALIQELLLAAERTCPPRNWSRSP